MDYYSKGRERMYIGIDPSTTSTGFAVFKEDGTLIEKGKFLAEADDPKAFQSLYKDLSGLFLKYQPKAILCEQQHAGQNAKTMIKLVRPTGVVLAAAGLVDAIFDFKHPSSWRKIYHTGTEFEKKYSKADSFKVTKERFPGAVTSFKKDNDISDAIGLGYACHILFSEVAS